MTLATNYRAQVGDAADFLLDYKWMFQHYTILRMTTRQIGVLIGCGKKAVTTALKRHKITLITIPRDSMTTNFNNFSRQVHQLRLVK